MFERIRIYFPCREIARELEMWLFEPNDQHSREQILETFSYATCRKWKFWFDDSEYTEDLKNNSLRVHGIYKDEIEVLFTLGAEPIIGSRRKAFDATWEVKKD